MEPPDNDEPLVRFERATLPGIVRRVRRVADLSQRELAARIGVSHSTISRLETGRLVPSVATLLRILGVAELMLVVTDADGHVIEPMRMWDEVRDGGDKTFPAHLDLILDPAAGDWWASRYGLARPPETYHRSRTWRDAKRRRSQWEVRVKQFKNDPPPRIV
ncbi:helix-turn-helix domain-containing protein [Jiangella endophytica]|uniref:helix-turn-helix domain-containing protein n=1 Tax=Jiangella endophytica TaxID=1623398 RepID=UPI001E384BC5|nr:helix-turn-helix transcriptional regulator [Jiangella endophytica]